MKQGPSHLIAPFLSRVLQGFALLYSPSPDVQNKLLAHPYFHSAVHILVMAYGRVGKCQVFKKTLEGAVEW